MKQYTVEEITVIQSKPVLTPAEAALVAGVSVGTLYKQWKVGTGPQSFHIGRARRIRRESLMTWMKQAEKLATAKP